VEPQVLRGIVTRPSLLHRLKANKGNRFGKNATKQTTSTVGKIRVVVAGEEKTDDGTAEEDDEDDEQEDDEQEDADASAEETAEEKVAESSAASEKDKKQPKQTSKPKKSVYSYNIKDIVDHSVVLREGDEVEFLAHASVKGLRASKIRVVALHAKQGVVTKVTDDFSGLICVDSDEGLEIPFAARNVLRGDVLGEGDRVEFAHSMVRPSTTRKLGTAAAAKASDSEAVVREENMDADVKEAEKESEPEKPFVGQATSVLRLSAASSNSDARTARAPRVVNSTLLQAMRSVGASAVVSSRMAKGPDGTRGFKEGWRTIPTTTAVAPTTSTPAEATAPPS
jgi:hypothetical protein